MLWLSEVMLQGQDIESFEQLKQALKERARGGELFFQMDVKPAYPFEKIARPRTRLYSITR